jgi:predicted transcriptional regulator
VPAGRGGERAEADGLARRVDELARSQNNTDSNIIAAAVSVTLNQMASKFVAESAQAGFVKGQEMVDQVLMLKLPLRWALLFTSGTVSYADQAAFPSLCRSFMMWVMSVGGSAALDLLLKRLYERTTATG